jgi:hypothetical protein
MFYGEIIMPKVNLRVRLNKADPLPSKRNDPKFILGKEKDPKDKRKENLSKRKRLAESPKQGIDLFSLEKKI